MTCQAIFTAGVTFKSHWGRAFLLSFACSPHACVGYLPLGTTVSPTIKTGWISSQWPWPRHWLRSRVGVEYVGHCPLEVGWNVKYHFHYVDDCTIWDQIKIPLLLTKMMMLTSHQQVDVSGLNCELSWQLFDWLALNVVQTVRMNECWPPQLYFALLLIIKW